jgi:carbon-monoxide dehydrogenase medium subunit
VRHISIDELLVDTFTSALKEGELVAEVSIPMPPEIGSGGAYVKLGRKAGDFATVGVAVQLTLKRRTDGSYSCTSAGIGLTALGPKNLRASKAEGCLEGKKLTKETVAEASAAAAKECSPTDDPLRGSAKYKREMAEVFTRRAIELATGRAQQRAGVSAN